jgi:hypothetical protein
VLNPFALADLYRFRSANGKIRCSSVMTRHGLTERPAQGVPIRLAGNQQGGLMKGRCCAAFAAAFLVVAPVAYAAKDHVTVAVTFDPGAGKPAVGEDPIVTTADEGGLIWEIKTPGYQFAKDGVTINPAGKHECHIKTPTIMRCAKLGHHAGDKFHYTVRIVSVSQPDKPAILDPLINYN